MNIQNRKSITSARRIALFLKSEYCLSKSSLKRMGQGFIDFNYLVASGSRQYAFKIFNTRNASQIDFELSVLQRLARFGFRSPRLVLSVSKKRSSLIAGRPCALLGFIPGRVLLRPSAKDMRVIGQMLGEFHVRLRAFSQRAKKQTWEPADIAAYLKTQKRSIIAKRYPGADELIAFIQQELKSITFPKILPRGITHQDVKPDNIVRDGRGRIHFIDFDGCYRGALLYDLMTPVIWTCFTKTGQLRKQHIGAIIKGYESARPLADKEKRHLYDALRFRLLREAFVWPMRFSPRLAQAKSFRFLRAYKQIGIYKSFIESLCRI